jgi:hypothetical protein
LTSNFRIYRTRKSAALDRREFELEFERQALKAVPTATNGTLRVLETAFRFAIDDLSLCNIHKRCSSMSINLRQSVFIVEVTCTPGEHPSLHNPAAYFIAK